MIRLCSSLFDIVEYYIQQSSTKRTTTNYNGDNDNNITTTTINNEKSKNKNKGNTNTLTETSFIYEEFIFDLIGNSSTSDIFSVNFNPKNGSPTSTSNESEKTKPTHIMYPGGLQKIGQLYISSRSHSSSSSKNYNFDIKQNQNRQDQEKRNGLEIILDIDLLFDDDAIKNEGNNRKRSKSFKDNYIDTKCMHKDKVIAIYLNRKPLAVTEYEVISYEELIADYMVFSYNAKENFVVDKIELEIDFDRGEENEGQGLEFEDVYWTIETEDGIDDKEGRHDFFLPCKFTKDEDVKIVEKHNNSTQNKTLVDSDSSNPLNKSIETYFQDHLNLKIDSLIKWTVLPSSNFTSSYVHNNSNGLLLPLLHLTFFRKAKRNIVNCPSMLLVGNQYRADNANENCHYHTRNVLQYSLIFYVPKTSNNIYNFMSDFLRYKQYIRTQLRNELLSTTCRLKSDIVGSSSSKPNPAVYAKGPCLAIQYYFLPTLTNTKTKSNDDHNLSCSSQLSGYPSFGDRSIELRCNSSKSISCINTIPIMTIYVFSLVKENEAKSPYFSQQELVKDHLLSKRVNLHEKYYLAHNRPYFRVRSSLNHYLKLPSHEVRLSTSLNLNFTVKTNMPIKEEKLLSNSNIVQQENEGLRYEDVRNRYYHDGIFANVHQYLVVNISSEKKEVKEKQKPSLCGNANSIVPKNNSFSLLSTVKKPSTAHFIDGPYLYLHYGHLGVDDRGWGCAYRSLQTLVSYFYLNGYIEEKYNNSNTSAHYDNNPYFFIPTHEEIQRLLVSIGDKPSSFLNSREWIGSFEVGYFLAERCKIQWKNLHLESSADLASNRVAKQISQHFAAQGTPIMLGGGNLAYTILGINWSEEHEEVQYLILDPHLFVNASSSRQEIQEEETTRDSSEISIDYDGDDEEINDSLNHLRQIEAKTSSKIRHLLNQDIGYGSQGSNQKRFKPCQWRKVSSFAKGCFYNLCLPQKPLEYF